MLSALEEDTTRERKTSVVVDPVKIINKPSTELIPDEYEHTNNEYASIHIFKSTRIKKKCEKTFIETMKSMNYRIPKENIHDFDRCKDVFDELERIREQLTRRNSMLIIAVFGFYEENNPSCFKLLLNKDMPFMKIWENFTGRRCPQLKDKPKLFLLQAEEHVSYAFVQQDGIDLSSYQKRFDMPAETDILVVHSKMSNNEPSFLNDFCKSMKLYGRKEEIVGLLSCTQEAQSNRAIILSTLTRKFYPTPSSFRGHHLDLTEHTESLNDKMKELQNMMDEIHNSMQSSEQKEEYGRLQTFFDKISIGEGVRSRSQVISSSQTDGAISPEAQSSTYSCILTGLTLVSNFIGFLGKIIVIMFFCVMYLMYFVMSE